MSNSIAHWSRSPQQQGTYPYYLENGTLYKWIEKDGRQVAVTVSRSVYISEIKTNVDTGRITLTLTYDYGARSYQHDIGREVLTRNKIGDLLAYGVDVADHKARDVLTYLDLQEAHAPVTLVHTKLGFVPSPNDITTFRHYKAIGMESTYQGPLQLRPKGSLETWRHLVLTEVLGHTPLELALVLGCSAVVSAMIGIETGLETIVVHIYGDSTQGKTSALRLATSTFGLPHTTRGGLIRTWNGTPNAILGHFRNNFGIPMGLDEASVQCRDDFTSVIYQLAGGQDKDRMGKDSNLLETAGWAGTIISTAEHSLSGKAKQNTGLQMRLLEFGNIMWTRSAANADILKEALLDNYGWAGPIFAARVTELGINAVVERWRIWSGRITERMPTTDHFASRMASKLAVLMVTAELAAENLELDLNIQGILDLLLSAEQVSLASRDIGENAYNSVLEAFSKHQAKFVDSEQWSKNIELWGKYTTYGTKVREIYFLPDVLRSLLKDAGFEDYMVVLRSWKEKGLLDHEKGKLTRKKSLAGMAHNVYVLKVRGDDLPEEPKPAMRIPKESEVMLDLFGISREANTQPHPVTYPKE